MMLIETLYIFFVPKRFLSEIEGKIAKGQYREAFRSLKVFLRIRPGFGKGKLLVSQACIGLRRYSVALSFLSKISEGDRLFAEAQFLKGKIYSTIGRIDTAVEFFISAVNQGMNTELLWLNLASSHYQIRDFDGLRKCAENLLLINPDSVDGYFFSGESLRFLGDVKLAQKAFLKALTLKPNMFYAVESMVWMKTNAFGKENALEFLKEVIESKSVSDKPPYLGLRGELLVREYEYREAEVNYRQALEIKGGEKSARIWTNLGVLLWYVSRVSEAQKCFEIALSIDPNYNVAKLHRSFVRLLEFQFSLAWDDYEYRKVCGDSSVRIAPLPDWSGPESRASKLLIYAEQGLGDEIMFASCIPDLQEDVDECVIECDQKLMEIFTLSFPWAQIVASDRSAYSLTYIVDKFPHLDCAIPIGSLPKFYRSSIHWNTTYNYLAPSAEKVAFWKRRLEQLGGGLKIGISWRGGTDATRKNLRSIPLIDWKKIFDIPNCKFISLQYGDWTGEISQVEKTLDVELAEWREALDDYHETAALTKALDLVVSVQTSIVHLSGAMGVRTLALIPFGPEWRYGCSGEIMPWYQSVKLIRQKNMGEWMDVFDSVVEHVAKISSNEVHRSFITD